MIETDSPYLTPIPHRGKRNEPYMVKYIAKEIAKIKNITIDEVANQTSKTAKAFFGI
jgi:TatD DNase family protein